MYSHAYFLFSLTCMKYDLFYLINEHKNDYTKNSYQILYLLSLSLLIIVSNELKNEIMKYHSEQSYQVQSCD